MGIWGDQQWRHAGSSPEAGQWPEIVIGRRERSLEWTAWTVLFRVHQSGPR